MLCCVAQTRRLIQVKPTNSTFDTNRLKKVDRLNEEWRELAYMGERWLGQEYQIRPQDYSIDVELIRLRLPAVTLFEENWSRLFGLEETVTIESLEDTRFSLDVSKSELIKRFSVAGSSSRQAQEWREWLLSRFRYKQQYTRGMQRMDEEWEAQSNLGALPAYLLAEILGKMIDTMIRDSLYAVETFGFPGGRFTWRY